MTSSRLTDELIREELRRTGGNISLVARRLGLNFEGLRARYGAPALEVFRVNVEEPEDVRDLARPELRAFVVAVKRAGSAWPEKYAAEIDRARRRYDAGTHEMCQGKTGGWVVLYLIPRIFHVRPRRYFATMQVMS